MPAYLATGQRTCHDVAGAVVPCAGSGQDAERAPGHPWPEPRFRAGEGVAADLATGLTWTLDANPAEFPLTWPEALEFVAGLNREAHLGYDDWRLPNRRELRSLVSHQTKNPALPEDHPFAGVFLGWYWSSTTAARAPAFAWYVHLEGGRMFYGRKDSSYLLWPVRGASPVLAATGQRRCWDADGAEIPCEASGQDAAMACGVPWPQPRFAPGRGERAGAVRDRLTGLWWRRSADAGGGPLRWSEALAAASGLGRGPEGRPWRLPTINELESVVDAERHDPALPAGHPFTGAAEAYWSSTTSLFEPDWAWALYLHKGACGVGQKKDPHFHAWAVSG